MPQPIDENPVPEDKLNEGLEEDIQPKPEEGKEPEDKTGEEGAKLPFHQDPNVQLYIERQVAKRVGEGNAAWEGRMAKLEERLQQGQRLDAPAKIGDWTPSSPEEARAAKAIVQQAKQEFAEDLKQQDEQAQARVQAENEMFSDWLTELAVTGIVKKEEQNDFAKMISDYGLEDQQKALNLWNRLQQQHEAGERAGEEKGIKRAQEAKIGSSRKGNEPGQQARSFKQRRAEEPNFDAILDRELNRLTNN